MLLEFCLFYDVVMLDWLVALFLSDILEFLIFGIGWGLGFELGLARAVGGLGCSGILFDVSRKMRIWMKYFAGLGFRVNKRMFQEGYLSLLCFLESAGD